MIYVTTYRNRRAINCRSTGRKDHDKLIVIYSGTHSSCVIAIGVDNRISVRKSKTIFNHSSIVERKPACVYAAVRIHVCAHACWSTYIC